MANDKEKSDYPERLLGRMLAETARAKAGLVPASAKPTDEEVLKLYERLSNPATSAAERAEAMSELLRNPEAYERWLTVTRFIEKHSSEKLPLRSNVAASQPVQRREAKTRESMGAKLQRLLSSFWYNPALSAAFGLALGVLVSSLYTGTPGSEQGADVPVYAQQGVPLPHKASQHSTDAEIAPAVTDVTNLDKAIRCVSTSAPSEQKLCFTATSPDQLWFHLSSSDQLKALTPPIETDRIVSTDTVENVLLVEHQREGEYRLSLVRFEETPQGLKTALLHEESAGEGYFDEVVLDKDGLTYMIHQGTDVMRRHFTIP